MDLNPGTPPTDDPEDGVVRSPEGAAPQGRDRVVGSALRSVYQATVDESIPDDLLDLLGKLS